NLILHIAMASIWRILCTLICGIEGEKSADTSADNVFFNQDRHYSGTVGLALSAFLLYIVLAKKSATTVTSYRHIFLTISNWHNLDLLKALHRNQCFPRRLQLWLAHCWTLGKRYTHALSDSYFISIVYGPVKYAPKWLMCKKANLGKRKKRDLVCSVAVFMVFSLWQFITAPCIVQYLVLFRKSVTNPAKIMIAYMFTVFSMALSAPYFWLFVPYPAIEDRLREIARRVQKLDDDEGEYVVYGIGMQEDPANGNRTAVGLAFYGIAPSYFLTYIAFGFTVFKIVHELARVNTEMSIKTVELQRGFIRMQLIQGFVPLAILTVPFATFITFIFTGANLNNWTLMLTFSLWSLPAVQKKSDLDVYSHRTYKARNSQHL
ncbi:hypothetical protein PRIPAC_80811, partial [Pristionchus pacificus]|uniref:G protein-coupled receptor n=1 Tax=Pristionchus pacificus TaxID=54126 RepID=A0A2A6BXC6_PRIPA